VRNLSLPTLLDFEQFWSLYPRKVAKREALLAWLDLSPSEQLTKHIMEALEQQISHPSWRDVNYVPHASRWLRQRRWEKLS
jgi:hypothetical protein